MPGMYLWPQTNFEEGYSLPNMPPVIGVQSTGRAYTTPPFTGCTHDCPSVIGTSPNENPVEHMWVNGTNIEYPLIVAGIVAGSVMQQVYQDVHTTGGIGPVQPTVGTPLYGIRATMPHGMVRQYRYPSMAHAARGNRTPATDLTTVQTYGGGAMESVAGTTDQMCPPAEVLTGFTVTGRMDAVVPVCGSVFDIARTATPPAITADDLTGSSTRRCNTYVDHIYVAGATLLPGATFNPSRDGSGPGNVQPDPVRPTDLFFRCASVGDYQSFRDAVNHGMLLPTDPTCAIVDGNDTTNRDICNTMAVRYCSANTGSDRDTYCTCIDAAAHPMPAPDPTHSGHHSFLPVRCTHPACQAARPSRSDTTPGTWMGGRTPNTMPVNNIHANCPQIDVCQVYTGLQAGGNITYRNNSLNVRCGSGTGTSQVSTVSTSHSTPPPVVSTPAPPASTSGTVSTTPVVPTSTTRTTTVPQTPASPPVRQPVRPPPVTGTSTRGGFTELLHGILTDPAALVIGGMRLPITKGHASIVAALLLVLALTFVLV